MSANIAARAAIVLMAMMLLAVTPGAGIKIDYFPDVGGNECDCNVTQKIDINLVEKLDLIERAKKDIVRSSWGLSIEQGTIGDNYFAVYDGNFTRKVTISMYGQTGSQELPSSIGKQVLLVNLTSEKYSVADYGAFEALREHFYG